MSPTLDRRDFLKIATLAAGTTVAWPYLRGGPAQAGANTEGKPNILVLVFDALSARHMSLHGYSRETTPNLARFAAKSTVFHNHHASGNFTSAGTGSLLTGTYPWSHRAWHLHSTVLKPFETQNLFSAFDGLGYHRLAYSHNLLVMSLLHQFQQGLETFVPTRDLCLVDDQVADRLFGQDFNAAFWGEWIHFRGSDSPPGSLYFSWLHRLTRRLHKEQIAGQLGDQFPLGVPSLHNLFFVLEDAIDWLTVQLADLPRPYLSYIHLLPPHEPYTPRADFLEMFRDGQKFDPKEAHFLGGRRSPVEMAHQRRLYDEFLAYSDAEFGRLMDHMETTGVLDDTVVVFTSDHGELFERGIVGHVTQALYDPVLHVPLMIHTPGQINRQDVISPSNAVDVLPTLLGLAGEPVPDWSEGQRLPLTGIPGYTYGKPQPNFALEAKSNAKAGPLTKATLAMFAGSDKLVHYLGFRDPPAEFELFDLINDPEEARDLFPSSPRAAQLQDLLSSRIDRINIGY
jgi:arylsulfatase A-like enzyme